MTANLEDLKSRIERLEMSQLKLEHELAIRELLALYGVYADTGMHDEFVDLFTDDCVVELHGGDYSGTYDDFEELRGKRELREYISDPRVHMRIQGRCAHLSELNFRARISGPNAVAETAALVIVDEDGEKRVYETTFNRWSLRHEHDRWRISKRTRYSVGTEGYIPHVGSA